jgi:hypothetical protein
MYAVHAGVAFQDEWRAQRPITLASSQIKPQRPAQRAAMTRNCFVVLERVKFSDQLIIYKGEAGDDFVSHEAVRQRHEAALATRNDTEAE